MKCVLPRPPSANHYYKFTSRPFPHWYITAMGKSWQTEAQWILRAVRGRRKTITGEVELQIDFYRTRRKLDSDNLLKAVFDAFTKSGVIADDEQIASHAVHRYYVPHLKEERLEIELFEL